MTIGVVAANAEETVQPKADQQDLTRDAIHVLPSGYGFPKVSNALNVIARDHKFKVSFKNTGYYNHESGGNYREPGAYFRLALTDKVLNAVVKELKLVKQSNSHHNVRRILTQFPYGWPLLNLNHCKWYGGRHNTEDSNYGSLMVLVADRKSKNIYLFVSWWDYTP